jgi:predicted ester cyclase
MSAEQNMALVRRFYEALDARGLAGIDQVFQEMVSQDGIMHFPGVPPLDFQGAKGIVAAFYSAFPDQRHSFEDILAEGDRVVTRVTVRGTHRGEFQGIPPTGKAVTSASIQIDRVAGGKIAEHWSSPDLLGLLQQLGAIPTAPAAPG